MSLFLDVRYLWCFENFIVISDCGFGGDSVCPYQSAVARLLSSVCSKLVVCKFG